MTLSFPTQRSSDLHHQDLLGRQIQFFHDFKQHGRMRLALRLVGATRYMEMLVQILGGQHSVQPDAAFSGGHAQGDLARPERGKQIGNAVEQLDAWIAARSEEHTSELQSLMRMSYDVICCKQ